MTFNRWAPKPETKKGRTTHQEIETTFQQSKSNEDPGGGRSTPDTMKADTTLIDKILQDLFNKICEEENVPESWKGGIIIKVHRKSNLTKC